MATRNCPLGPAILRCAINFCGGFFEVKCVRKQTLNYTRIKGDIIRAINNMLPDVCEPVIENFNDRIFQCRDSLDEHMPSVIFHT